MSETDKNQAIRIRPGSVTLVLGLICAFLLLMSIVTQVVRFEYRLPHGGLIRTFDLNMEGNIPTLFSSMLLLFSSVLLFVIGAEKKRRQAAFALHWTILAVIFLVLAADEAGGLHELTISSLRKLFHATGYLYFAWVIPAILLLIVFAVAYWRFLFHLAMKFRILFAIAGVVFVAGAVGMELIGGRYFWATRGRKDYTYLMMTTLEEALEMGGITLFIHGLLEYMRLHVPDIHFTVGRRPSR